MNRFNDHADQSSHASAAPIQAEGAPTHVEIEVRAYQLWLEQGRPPDSAEGNWLEAEHELRAAAKSHSLIAKVRGGSVQA
jgi:hypothetical protein